ncbi:MAG: YicC/YloC family endoribonuclease [Gemmatimonadales bacterium]
MTGFGAAEGPVAGGVLRIELKSVNHRYLTLSLKAPSELGNYEPEFRERLRRQFERGHFTASVRWMDQARGAEGPAVNVEKAKAAFARLRALEEAVGLSGQVTLDLVARQPDVLTSSEGAVEYPWAEIEAVLARAIEACRATRAVEGAALATELKAQVGRIRANASAVRARAPERMVRERDRLRAAVATLLDGRPIDEQRLHQEIAFLAEKLDVAEELVRLDAHLVAVDEALGANRAVGKHLGFLAQEIGREINTIGSKANDAAIQHLVVDMKGELERFREQLENLE